jgi:hypothetical protein
MTAKERTKSALDQKFKEVRETPAGFTFFVSLHDFVRYIESAPAFAIFFAGAKKGSRAKELSAKYAILKQIYQGIEDIDIRTADDLGHDRHVAIRDLCLIRNKNVSENNVFWRERETLRKLAGAIHGMLLGYLSESEPKTEGI